MNPPTSSLPPDSPWLTAPPPREAGSPRPRLFCFPYAGGGASASHAWGRELAPLVDVCPVRLPGREARLSEPAESSLVALVARLVPALAPWLEPPYAFFGHSMGGLIAFELARALRRHGLPLPSHVVVSGAGAPHTASTNPPLHRLTDRELLAGVERLEGTSPEVLAHAELVELLLPALRADLTLCETITYREEPPLASPIVAYGGLDDRAVPLPRLEAWRDLTGGGFRMRLFAGGHFFLRERRTEVLEALLEDLGLEPRG